MNIVVIGPYFPYRGGISDTNQELCENLQKLGHSVIVFTFSLQYPSIFFPGKTQLSSKSKSPIIKGKRIINSLSPFNWISTVKKINNIDPDMLISCYWTPYMAPCFSFINRLINKKIKKIGLIHNAFPHEAAQHDPLIPDTIILPDKPNSDGLYTHYFTKDGQGPFEFNQDSFLRRSLADSGFFLRMRSETGDSRISPPPPPPPGNINKAPNIFGGGTGFNISQASVNNKFVPHPSMNQPVVISTPVSGGTSSTTINSQQIHNSTGNFGRNPFYTKDTI